MNKLKLGLTAVALALCAASAQALQVNIYSNYTETLGTGITFSNPAGSFTSPDIQFGASTGNNWHPFGLSSFGADITGSINAAGGSYLISLLSDDASYMFIDGVLRISRPGPHGPDFTSETINLAPGLHTVEVQFYECCGGPSALDAQLPQGVSFVVGTPDSGTTLALLGGALTLIGTMWRRFRN